MSVIIAAMSEAAASAVEVARYLILLAASEEEAEPLTLSRLQKLLYYVQGWSLVERGAPLFSEPIEVWSLGPVVPAVWKLLAGHGKSPIPAGEGACRNLSEEDGEFIRRVWESYRQYSASGLAEMAPHRAGRWQTPGSTNGAPSRQISLDDLRKRFAELAR